MGNLHTSTHSHSHTHTSHHFLGVKQKEVSPLKDSWLVQLCILFQIVVFRQFLLFIHLKIDGSQSGGRRSVNKWLHHCWFIWARSKQHAQNKGSLFCAFASKALKRVTYLIFWERCLYIFKDWQALTFSKMCRNVPPRHKTHLKHRCEGNNCDAMNESELIQHYRSAYNCSHFIYGIPRKHERRTIQDDDNCISIFAIIRLACNKREPFTLRLSKNPDCYFLKRAARV